MKQTATDRNLFDFFRDYYKLEGTYFEYELTRDGFVVLFNPKNTVLKNKFKKKISELLENNFTGAQVLDKGKSGKYNKLVILTTGSSTAGVIPTAIQEKGTTFVFNQVLKHNKRYEKMEDILGDIETAKGLEKIFGVYKDRLVDWTHSYFEQQKEFLKEFSDSKWDEFEYGKQDFVTFFSDQIRKVVETPEPIKPVGKYTTWNPSDIWAVYDKKKVQDQIKKNLNPKTQSLTELNSLLINLFQEKKLIGLSLKKIAKNQSAKLKFVNIDTSTMKLGDIEEFTMRDIKFDLHNLFGGDSNTTYVHFGNKDYSIYITKIGTSSDMGNLSFSTQIKNSAAQAGQVPVKMVSERLKKSNSRTTFVNDHKQYPQSAEDFLNDSKRDYLKYFNFVSEKNIKSVGESYEDFEKSIVELYREGKKNIAISKLMQLNFYYDSSLKNSSNPEFWTDLLYFGMKMGKRFAPHAKIS